MSKAIAMLQVMRVLKASPFLLPLLREVEGDLGRFTGQAGRRPEGVHADVLPFLVTQGQDWEAYASSSQPSTTSQQVSLCRMSGEDDSTGAPQPPRNPRPPLELVEL